MLRIELRDFLRPAWLLWSALILGTIAGNAADTMSDDISSTSAASQPTERLVSKFTAFAGSSSNAQALVNGLRNDASVTLKSATPMTPDMTFTSPTKPMGFGNINIALSLAESELTAQGITQPTPSQIQTALMGGQLTTPSGTTNLPGILILRSEGNGWGEIAHTLGFRLGDVMRSEKAHRPDKVGGIAQLNKPERPERVEHADRLDRPARPERPERPERVDRPDRPKH